MTALGVTCGLLSALCLSVSYLFMRRHSTASGWQLSFVVRGQILQGLLCLVLLPIVWPATGIQANVLIPAAAAAAFFLGGQVGLLTAISLTEASRVSPLLGIKIALVAAITVTLLGNHLNALQWTAVALAVIAAVGLNQAGGRPPTVALVAAGLASLCYASSDVCLRQTLIAIKPLGLAPLHVGLLLVVLVYVIAGIITLPAVAWFGSTRPADWFDATPFALSWLLGALCLLTAFALVGVVLGDILQSTRGIISIVLGALLATRGMEHLEQRIGRGVFWRRLAAGCLMSIAIALFLLGR